MRDIELVSDLNNDVFSTRLEADPSEPVKTLARPLISEPARLNEALTDLKNEVFSARLEDEPSEALKFTVRPLKKEVTRPNESLSDLKNEDFSVRLVLRNHEHRRASCPRPCDQLAGHAIDLRHLGTGARIRSAVALEVVVQVRQVDEGERRPVLLDDVQRGPSDPLRSADRRARPPEGVEGERAERRLEL